MYKKIALDAPNIGEVEKEYILKALDSGYVSAVGPLIAEFEKSFASYLGVENAVSTQSGTAAIHMALYELGIGEGDEVIVPAMTFIATVNPIVYVGAKPVFADVNAKTWNIDPEEVEKKITGKTKAILPVHLYGNPCDMKGIMDVAKRKGLYIIEDATESLCAKYKGRQTGTFGDFGCFSFNGNKMITTGGGGMLAARDKRALKHIKFLVNQGRDKAEEYYHSEIGFNYRMTNIEAALGLAQMEKIDEFLAKKRRFNLIYRNELKSVKAIRFQEEHEGAESSWWLTCVVFDKGVNLPMLQKELRDRGVPTRKIFMPVTEFPPYRENKRRDYKNSYYINGKGLCLPSSTLNTEDDIFNVCKIIKRFF